jgi:hypothetical protein
MSVIRIANSGGENDDYTIIGGDSEMTKVWINRR